MIALQAVLGTIVAALNLVYWWLVAMRGSERFRLWCERRFGVTIRPGFRGSWQVSGPQSWLYRVGVELLQVVFVMGAFVTWAAAMMGVVALLSLLDPR